MVNYFCSKDFLPGRFGAWSDKSDETVTEYSLQDSFKIRQKVNKSLFVEIRGYALTATKSAKKKKEMIPY